MNIISIFLLMFNATWDFQKRSNNKMPALNSAHASAWQLVSMQVFLGANVVARHAFLLQNANNYIQIQSFGSTPAVPKGVANSTAIGRWCIWLHSTWGWVKLSGRRNLRCCQPFFLISEFPKFDRSLWNSFRTAMVLKKKNLLTFLSASVDQFGGEELGLEACVFALDR